MKTRKITFEVGISRKFDDSGKWPIGDSDFETFDVDLEFKWDRKSDVMKDAEQVLDKHMKKNYKNKQYKIFYWWWKD